tara:strand:- start:427 stop:804 length:378 start_codon:yes stop_codon:yes gene_type:complete
MKITLPIHADVNNSAKLRYVSLTERMQLDSVTVISNGAVTAHAANGLELKVLGNDGATDAFKYSSLSGANGTIADATTTDLVDQKSSKAVYGSGTAVKISIDGSLGAGVTADVVLCLHFSQARKV